MPTSSLSPAPPLFGLAAGRLFCYGPPKTFNYLLGLKVSSRKVHLWDGTDVRTGGGVGRGIRHGAAYAKMLRRAKGVESAEG